MISKRIITTWICDPQGGRDSYLERHKQTFYQCLESWHRLMPDYDIQIVSLANITDLGGDPWIEARLEEGNFIGASQWARCHWLHEIGGIYLDMDVQAVRRFDDLRENKFFCGHEGGDSFANNAVMGSESGNWFVRQQLDYVKGFVSKAQLDDPQFGNETGPRMLTTLLMSHGWKRDQDATQIVKDLTVYHSRYFYPYFWTQQFDTSCIERDTYAVHRWASSWVRDADMLKAAGLHNE